MKILELEVEGYRSLKSVKWAPGDLNVLIGPNGSGKTNLLRVLELLGACARGTLSNRVQQEGGFLSMVWDQNPIKPVKVCLRASPTIDRLMWLLKFPDKKSPESVRYEISLRTFFPLSMPFVVESESLTTYSGTVADALQEPMELLHREITASTLYSEHSGTMVDANELVSTDEALVSVARPPFQLNYLLSQYQQALSSWTVYQDLWPRVYASQSLFASFRSIREPTQPRYETRVSPEGSNLMQVLHTYSGHYRDVESKINDAIRAAYGNDFDEMVFPPAADGLIQLRMRWKSLQREVSAMDVSDGTLRFLFLLAVLANPDPPPVIAIEEPEVGLHPSMLPIIAEFAVEASSRAQIIFTTHSPDFLSTFRDVTPTTTVFGWENGQTMLRVLSGAELDYWLKDYSLGELFRSGQLESME